MADWTARLGRHLGRYPKDLVPGCWDFMTLPYHVAQLVENSSRWLMSFPSSVLQKWDVGSTSAKLEGYLRAEYESRPFQSISLVLSEVTRTSGQADASRTMPRIKQENRNSRLLYQDVVTFAVPFGGFLFVWHVVFTLLVPRIFRSAFNLDGQKACSEPRRQDKAQSGYS
jgi:hypothetical protein